MSAEKITKLIKYIGKNIKPSYPIVLVAAAEIVFRPLFTMMDKKSPNETKKYTALREAVTEVVAVPTYLTCGALAASGAKLFKDAKTATRAKHNLELMGLWTAALVVIPGLCSVFVKPFTEKLFNKKKPEVNHLDTESAISSRNNEVLHSLPISYTGQVNAYPKCFSKVVMRNNMGMRV